MSQQNKIIKEIFNQTAQRIVSSSKELYQFLLQNRYMYELPITKIIEIYGQNQNVTRLKTFNEWQALGAKVIKGQTGIPTLNEPDNPFSKRTTYFDITQVVHSNLKIDNLTLSEVQIRKFLQLANFSISENNDATKEFDHYISATSNKGLASFGFLSAEEKIVVPLIAQFSLKTAFNLSTEEEDVSLVQDIQDYFEEQPNLRPLEIIKIANNLSKSIVVSMKNNYETLQKAQKIEDERLAQLEQAFNQEFIDKTIPEDIFPSSLEVSETQQDKSPIVYSGPMVDTLKRIDENARYSDPNVNTTVKATLLSTRLRTGTNKIYQFFEHEYSKDNRADFLKEVLGVGGETNNGVVNYHYDDKGLTVRAYTEVHYLVRWDDVAFWVDDLISEGLFLDSDEKKLYQEWELKNKWLDEANSDVGSQQKNLLLQQIEHYSEEQSFLPKVEVEMTEPKPAFDEISLFDFDTESSDNSFPENGHFFIEDNETNEEMGLTSFANTEITPDVLIGLQELDEKFYSNSGYYKFFIEDTDNYSIRLDIGDGVESNQGVYREILQTFSEAEVAKFNQLKEQALSTPESNKSSELDSNESYHSLNNMVAISEYGKTITDLDEKEQISVQNAVRSYLDEEAYNAFNKRTFSELTHSEKGAIVNAYVDQIETLAKEKGIYMTDMDNDASGNVNEPAEKEQSYSDQPTPPHAVFHFPQDLTDFYPNTPTQKVNANIEAIQLVKKLQKENRQATSTEQRILAKYVGWGGLANTFFDENLKRYEGQRQTLKSLVTPNEYAEMRQSSLTAYYTDPEIIRSIYLHLEKQGFKGGRILDPAMGTGNFFSAMPADLRDNSQLYGVELDSLSGAIAKQLHPDTDVKVQGFETTAYNDKSFDLVIGNVPFADFSIMDDKYGKPYAIHDYFFKKSMDLVRDGGVVAFITSTWTMNKKSTQFRNELNGIASFVGGVRLPNDAFKHIAGTDVATDILFFKKGEYAHAIDNWIDTAPIPNPSGGVLEGVVSNDYFTDLDKVAGQYITKNFHGKTLSVAPFDKPLIKQVDKILDNQSFTFDSDLSSYGVSVEKETSSSQFDMATLPEEVLNLEPQSHIIVDKKIYFNDGIDGIVEKNKDWFDQGYIQKRDKDDVLKFNANGQPLMWWSRTQWTKTTMPRLTAMVEISQLVQDIISYQHEHSDLGQEDPDFSILLDKLNSKYDEFTTNKALQGKYGNPLNRKENAQLFEDDVNYYSVLAIEDEYRDDKGNITYKKSDFFYKKTISAKQEIVVSTPVDALNASINKYGAINFTYMSELLPLSKEEYINELKDAIFYNPTSQKYEQSDEYLSGHVTTKMEQLDIAKANHDISNDVYETNKKALEEVLPEPLSITEIDYKIGSRFISTEIYQKFLSEKVFGRTYDPDGITDSIWSSKSILIEYNTTLSKYIISDPTLFNGKRINRGLYPDLIIDKQTRTHNPVHIFNDMLNLRKTKVEYMGEDDKRHVDPQLTAVAESKQKLLALEFENFVLENDEIRKEITDVYNRNYNSTVIRSYNGENLTFDGLTRDITLRPHQKDAVSRVVQSQRALFAHVVGSGKTLSMIASGMKLKELGIAKKPLYVVPKSILKQFASDVKKFYPDKKILAPSPRDFEKERRRKLVARIGAGDYDAVILSHEQFGKIPLTKEREEEYLNEELATIQFAILKAKAENGKSPSVKQMVALEKSLKKKLDDLKTAKDDGVIFENLGVDFIFVDEAHNFKNLSYRTELSDVKGVNMTASQKASDLLLKAKYIQEKNEKGGGLVFATGTPVSNSMAEMYTMMRFLEPDYLIENNIRSFDEWAAMFAHIETNMEVDQTGQKWKQVTRFSKFNNLPELMKLYQNVADIQTADMLDLPTPEVANDGKPFVIVSDPSEAQQLYMDELIKRSDAVASGSVDPTEDNMLRITTHARLMATDMRLIDPAFSSADSQKAQQVAENVFKVWQENHDSKATQMIFSDIGTPKTQRKGKDTSIESADELDYNFNVYQDIKAKLISMGIPANEIAFVHDAGTDIQKEALFEKVRSGDTRILFASTQKGGTGVNVQDKLIAVHHVDVPWRPSDIEQRNGRIIRQGNTNSKVQIYNYVTKGTFDTFMWQIQEQKLKYITQVMSGKSASRSMDEMDDLVLTASEIKAVATNNPYIKEKMELENTLANLTISRNYFIKSLEKNDKEIKRLETSIPQTERHLERLTADKITAERYAKQDAELQQAYELSLNDYHVRKGNGEENLIKPIEPPFEITLEGHGLITNKTEAGEIINTIVHNAYSDESHDYTIGNYKGFELKGRTKTTQYSLHSEDTIYLVGETTHPLEVNVSSPIGTVTRINNLVTGKIIRQPEVTQANLDTDKETLDKLKLSKDSKFDKEDEFRQLTLRLDEVNQKIEESLSQKNSNDIITVDHEFEDDYDL